MKYKYLLTMGFSIVWFSISLYFSYFWVTELSAFLPELYVLWVVFGIALIPGFLMSGMFFSNLLFFRRKELPDIQAPVDIIICAYNEEDSIYETIQALVKQKYREKIRLIVVDNASTDETKTEIARAILCFNKVEIIYVYCETPGKANALNCGLKYVRTEYFLSVDADTILDEYSLKHIINNIIHYKSACVAGNLLAQNDSSLISKMQRYDYYLSIAAIKRYQGSYHATLVAQGAFSAYNTCAVREVGGWKEGLGEDIVLTYQLLETGCASTYESKAVGYTKTPSTFFGLYNQRKRWASGMLEGFKAVPPRKQGTFYSKYFALVNLSIIYLDFAYLFGFLPGVILAFFGIYWFAGIYTLLLIPITIAMYSTFYCYQKRNGITMKHSFFGFVSFLLLFQFIQSCAAVHGYMNCLFRVKGNW